MKSKQNSKNKGLLIAAICAIILIIAIIIISSLLGGKKSPGTNNENPPAGESGGPADDTPNNKTPDDETPDDETPDSEMPDSETPDEPEETVADVDSLTYSREGSTVYFGAYPQTLVCDESVLSALNAKIKALPTEGEAGSDGWTSYGYFALDDETRNLAESNYMWYKDVVSGGVRYRGVYFTSYRANSTTDSDRSTDKSFQDDNGYTPSNVYWFKHEPIAWAVVAENEGTLTLVCNLAIDAQQYDYAEGKRDYRARYDQSTIRAWLNESFYNTAFNELQTAMIEKTLVDNSLPTHDVGNVPAGVGENTEDNVFLLSAEEAKTYFSDENARKKKATDYAKAQGLSLETSSQYKGNCSWWLRSGSVNYYDYAQNVGPKGTVQQSSNCYITKTNAIVPAVKIILP